MVSAQAHTKHESYHVKHQEVSRGGVKDKGELENEIVKADIKKCNIKVRWQSR